MDKLTRLMPRLRQHALRCYEFGLYVLLVALALAVALPAAFADADDAAPQCGGAGAGAPSEPRESTLPAWGMPHPPSR